MDVAHTMQARAAGSCPSDRPDLSAPAPSSEIRAPSATSSSPSSATSSDSDGTAASVSHSRPSPSARDTGYEPRERRHAGQQHAALAQPVDRIDEDRTRTITGHV